MRARLSIAILAVLALLAGCERNKNGEHIVVRDKDGNVSITGNGEHFSMHSSNGKAQIDINTNGVSVSGLPSFVAVYPGAKVITSAAGTDNNGAGGTIVLEAKAAPDAVVAFYRQRSTGAGFKEETNMNMEGNSRMFGAKSGDRTILVIVSKTDEGTHAQVSWSGK